MEAKTKGLFKELFADCYKQLFVTAYIQVHNENDASDLVQDTALLAFKNFNQLKEIAYFKTWITRILLNNIKKFFKQKREVNLFDDRIFEATDQTNREETIILLDAIKKLNQKEQDVLILQYFLGYTICEVSKILKMPQGTVKSKTNRSLKKLKELLKEESA